MGEKNPNLKQKKLYSVYAILLCLGIIFTLILMYDRYILPSGDSSFCAFGDNFDCGKVAQSPYAAIDGILYFTSLTFDVNLPYPVLSIPNPLVLFVGFIVWMYVVRRLICGKGSFKTSFVTSRRVVLGTYIFGTLYAAYLLYVSSFLLETFCIFCLLLDLVMISTFVLFVLMAYRT